MSQHNTIYKAQSQVFHFSPWLLCCNERKNKMTIIGVQHPAYIKKRHALGAGRWNGAYYYAKEIEKNIIPNVKTKRNWILVNVPGVACDHAIVFIHNNLHPENYNHLKAYKDLILVCGIPETVEKVKHIGKAIYLPLSIDVDYVKQFAKNEKKGIAYVGRRSKSGFIPAGTQIISGLPREELLKKMAGLETVYAEGRCAIEARCLGCEVKPSERFPDASIWKVVDNKEAAKMLQEELDKIDKEEPIEEIHEEVTENQEETLEVSMDNTKAELIEYAKAHGIEVKASMNKAQILELIKA